MLTILSAGLVSVQTDSLRNDARVTYPSQRFLLRHCSDEAWHRGYTQITSVKKSLIHNFLSELLLERPFHRQGRHLFISSCKCVSRCVSRSKWLFLDGGTPLLFVGLKSLTKAHRPRCLQVGGERAPPGGKHRFKRQTEWVRTETSKVYHYDSKVFEDVKNGIKSYMHLFILHHL